MEEIVNFSKNVDVKFLKKSKSCPKAQQNTLLERHSSLIQSVCQSYFQHNKLTISLT